MKCKWRESCGYDICMDECCPEFEGIPLTNADRIRAMSDEELAKVVSGTILCAPEGRCHGNPKTSCYECWLNWLKQPAKEEA